MARVGPPLPHSQSLKPKVGKCWREGEKMRFAKDMVLVL